MRHIPFTQVFLALMGLALASAFVIPPRYTDRGRVQLEGLFVPVSAPVYHLATWVRARWVNENESDPRPDQDIRDENVRLRNEVSRLTDENVRLADLVGESESLGNLGKLCDRFTVAGTDPSGNREGLTLSGRWLGDVREGQAVLNSGCLAGRIDRAGISAAHVRLVTDPMSIVNGTFVRFIQNGDRTERVTICNLLAIVAGTGQGRMHITNLKLSEVKSAGIEPGDWVVVNDQDFGAAQGLRIGRVEDIEPWKQLPLKAEIRLTDQPRLMHLQSVWVMTREKTTE